MTANRKIRGWEMARKKKAKGKKKIKRKREVKRRKKIKKTSKRFKIALVSVAITIGIAVLFLVIDLDGDGLSNLAELQHNTAMFNSDTDGDGLNDGVEVNAYKTNPLAADSDGDGLNDEAEINTHGTNPLVADTDQDGLNDGQELELGTEPLESDTDDDGIIDGSDSHPTTHEWKLTDSDGDGWSDYKEYYETKTERFNSDTDDDGYTDPNDPHPTTHEWIFMDSDSDGWSDYKEYYEEGTDRFDFDTDDDGYSDPNDPHPLTHEGYNVVHHEWDYGGSRWTYDTEIPKASYDYFSNKPRVSYYSEYVDNPADDTWMESLAHLFVEEAEEEGWGEFKTVSFVLAFVQSWPYTSDDVTTEYDEYPRYPVETIVESGGDCEDTSILFASIVRGMGYGTVLLHLEEDHHMAVGVLISQNIVDDWNQHYPLAYYTSSKGNIYAYCETTGEGWELGEKPDDLKSTSASFIFV